MDRQDARPDADYSDRISASAASAFLAFWYSVSAPGSGPSSAKAESANCRISFCRWSLMALLGAYWAEVAEQ